MDRPEKVLRALERMGEKQFVPSIGPVKGRVLEKVIKDHRVKKLLEIGTLYGYSAILAARNLPAEGKVISLEIDPETAKHAWKNIESSGLEDKIEVIVGDAKETLPEIHDKLDLLFIDAKKEEYLRYLKLAEKNLKKGSVVVADNVGIFKEEMKDYLDYVRGSKRYTSETVKIPLEFTKDTWDAMEISIQN
ncbi:MAG: O-methyltransferase [Candidatus Hydrothermarchaeales archaeon]